MEPNQPVLPPNCAARYRVKRRIGAGGQGVVYLATQIALDRPVALKVMQAGDDEFGKRFRQEAQVAARLSHPNLVGVLDHDVEGDLSWIAFEYVPGQSLRQRLAEQRLHWTEAVLTCAAVARGLAAVHAIGAVHRDVKPENVLLGAAEPKLTDFGLAKWDGAAAATQSGILLGTPAYMAPEVVRGERATPSADLYALGAMLFELIAGRALFDADQPVMSLQQHLQALDPSVVAELEAPPVVKQLIVRCVARDRRDRPESAAALADELSGLATTAVPRPSRTQIQQSLPRDTQRRACDTKVVSRQAPPRRTSTVWTALAAGVLLAVAARVALRRPPAPPPASPVPVTVAPVSGPDLAPLDARADRLGVAIEESATGLRAWEIELARQMAADAGVAMPNAVARARLNELASHRKALEENQAELARLEGDEPGVEQLRARFAGMRFEVWFWEGWGARYIADGDTYSPSDSLMTSAKPKKATGGKRLWSEFSMRLGAQLRRAAERPELFDRRLADALFQVSRACRHLRTRKDVEVFAESDLYPQMDGWVADQKKLPRPLGADLGAAVDVLARSGHETADATRLLPVLLPIAERASGYHPRSAAGWTRLVERMRASTPDGAPSGGPPPASPRTGASAATADPPRSR